MIGRLLAAAVALLSPVAAVARPPVEVLVPAYFYPAPGGSDWERLAAAARAGLPVTAIMNPASGPGDVADANYVKSVAALREAGGRVLGYLPTGYAGVRVAADSSCRPADGLRYTPADIADCANRYRAFYPLDGMFLDEVGGEAVGLTAGDVTEFYGRLYQRLTEIDAGWRVVGNPGTHGSDRLLGTGAMRGADALVVFEGFAGDFLTPAARDRSLPDQESHRGALVIGANASVPFASLLDLAETRGLGFLYVTERGLPNPYGGLPANWDEQVAMLRARNGPAR